MRKHQKEPIELGPAARPSRIRRDPPARPAKKPGRPYPIKQEVWVVVIGVILFALAMATITVGVSEVTSH
jgi:hypothetical protein